MKRYPAKILLFGEYAILLGSSALGRPFCRFTAALRTPGEEDTDLPSPEQVASNRQLRRLLDHYRTNPDLVESFLDLDRFGADIRNGLYFDSDIPVRYGVGSSGALCAALFGRFGKGMSDEAEKAPCEICHLALLKQGFSRLESPLHGKSSGFDPLISWLSRPVRIHPGGRPEMLAEGSAGVPPDGMEMFLADTGSPCATGPLVKDFLERFGPEGERKQDGVRYRDLTDAAVGAFLADGTDNFLTVLRELSAFQLEHLFPMVPPAMRPAWSYGLESGLFTLKLCGSGGGGFLLCFTRDMQATQHYFATSHFRYFAISS